MKQVWIGDMTLAGVSNAASLSFKEKIEIARHLDALGVDVIELAPVENRRADILLVRTISAFAHHSTLSMPVGMTKESVADAWEAVCRAEKPRLRVALPTSAVQMEYTCQKKAPKMLALISELVGAAHALAKDVEFCAVDATRADRRFLLSAIAAALEAGANRITLCDNEAVMMPDVFGNFISEVRAGVPGLSEVPLGVLCVNRFSMANASAMMAIKAGASEIKCAVGAAELPALETFAAIIRDCGANEGLTASLRFTQLTRITKQIHWITDTKHSDASPLISGAEIVEEMEGALALTGKDSAEAVSAAVVKLGYDLSDEDNEKVYEAFGRVAAKKPVTAKELDAIVASVALQVPPTYQIVSYVINSGDIITASAHLKLERNGEALEGICLGDGPIDASFMAIEQIVGSHFELDDFQIQAVTEGHEAMGAALVKLRSNGKLYSGRGISTDIIGASIRAYLSALNKIVYCEN